MIIKVSDIEIELIRKNIKNMHLYVMRPDGSIRVTAPKRISEETIRQFIISRYDWIKKQQKKINSEPKNIPITYSSGDKLQIFGEPYTLEIIFAKKNQFSFFNGRAILYCKENSSAEQREKIAEKELRCALSKELEEIIKKWENITALHSSSYQIKKMKTRWGTCNTRTRKIWLNYELIHSKRECIEYVVMHELAHLKVPNHGKDFIALMDRYMPCWKDLREELNKRC